MTDENIRFVKYDGNTIVDLKLVKSWIISNGDVDLLLQILNNESGEFKEVMIENKMKTNNRFWVKCDDFNSYSIRDNEFSQSDDVIVYDLFKTDADEICELLNELDKQSNEFKEKISQLEKKYDDDDFYDKMAMRNLERLGR